MDARIILAGQPVDLVGAMRQGNAAAIETNALRQNNQLTDLYRQQGAGLLAGDQGAMNALAGVDPGLAMGMKADQQTYAQNTRKMEITEENLKMSYDAARQQAAEAARGMAAEERAAQAETLGRILTGAATFYAKGDQQGYSTWLEQNGADPAQYPFAQFPAHAATVKGAMDALKEFTPEPVNPMDALNLEQKQLEVAALRNPTPDAPKTLNIKLADGSDAVVQWNAQTKTWDPASIPAGGASGQPKDVLTESQSKLTLFQTLQTETAPVLSQIEQIWDPANIPDAAARSTPIAGNFFQSQQGQIYNVAAAAWAEGALRIATGAAAQDDEIKRTVRTYFAQPGDTPQTVQFKNQMRAMYERAIQKSLGARTVDGQLSLPADFAASIAGDTAAPATSIPSGAVELLLQNNTEEYRKFFDEVFGQGAAAQALGGN